VAQGWNNGDALQALACRRSLAGDVVLMMA
jgi:hypothetical protein